MAPIKFEDHIKEQLEKRELEPSAGSWEKLNAKLENESSVKSNRKWWIGAVAAVVVALITTIFIFNEKNDFAPKIVDTPQIEEAKEPVKNSQFQAPVEVAEQEPKEIESFQKSYTKPTESNPPASSASENTEVAVADIPENQTISERQKIPVLNSVVAENSIEKTLLSNKLKQIVSEVKRKQRSEEALSTTEVEALLAQAAVEISKTKADYSNGYIDPQALLADVEEEMYRSFKEKMFEVLKEGYQKAMIAVSNRTESSNNY